MSFVKKNKYTLIVIAIFVVLVFAGYQGYRSFFGGSSASKYGKAMERIKGNEIKSQKLEQVAETLKDKDFIKDAKVNVDGPLVKIIVTVNDDVSVDTAKKLTDTMFESFDEKQLSTYDFHLFIEKENKEDTSFPLIGQKHHENPYFSF